MSIWREPNKKNDAAELKLKINKAIKKSKNKT